MRLKHLLTKVWILLVMVLVTRHVSDPYRRTAFTLVLKMRILLRWDKALEFQIGRRVLKANLALLIQLLTSSSAPPSVLTTLPRMWIGYGFDAGEVAAVMVNPGFVYSNTTWTYVFYFYLAFVVIIAFILTASFKLSEEVSDSKLHSCFAFFKLTSTITAGVIFFQLYLQDNREPLTIFIMVVTGADMSLDFIEMAAGCASLGFNMVYPFEMNKSHASVDLEHAHSTSTNNAPRK